MPDFRSFNSTGTADLAADPRLPSALADEFEIPPVSRAGLAVTFLLLVLGSPDSKDSQQPAEKKTESDLFRIDVTAGERLRADIDADELDDGTELSNLDAALRVFDASGFELATNDDADDPDTGTHHLDPALDFTASTTGAYYVGVASHDNTSYDPNFPGMGFGSSTGEYVLQLTILPNQNPIGTDDTVWVEQDSSAVDPGVLANDSDPDGNALSASSATDPPQGTTSIGAGWSESGPGPNTVLYQPDAAYTGADSFQYTVQDGLGGTDTANVNVTVYASDDVISGSRDVTLVTNQDVVFDGIIGDGTYGLNDVDLFHVSLVAAETVTLDFDAREPASPLSDLRGFLRVFDASGTELASQGSWFDSQTGESHDDPLLEFTAPSTADFYVGVSGQSNTGYNPQTADSGFGSEQGRYQLKLRLAANLPPVPGDDVYSVEQDSTNAVLEVLRNDSDPEAAALNIDSTTAPMSGAASVQDGSPDTVLDTPNTSYTGADSFSYTVSDPGSLTETGNLTLSVHAADDTLATARSLSLTAGVELETEGIIGDGTQGSTDIDLFAVTLQAGQVLSVDVDAAQLDSGAIYSGLDGYLRIFDSSGVELSGSDNAIDPDTSNFLVDPVQTFVAPSTGTYSIGISGYGNSSYDSTTAGSGISGSTGAYRLQVLLEDNSAPLAVDDSAATDEDVSLMIDVLANDSDPDGDALTLVSVSTPTNGSQSWFYDSGLGRDVVWYTPNTGYTGNDSFTYTIQDEHGVQDTATVSLTVGIPNVVGFADSYDAVNDVPLVVSTVNGVLANDTDLDGDPLNAAKISDPSNGTLMLGGDGSFTYTPQ